MNAVEIEEAISRLAEGPFCPEDFAYSFLEAFGNKATTIKRLRSGTTNKSDLSGGLLQRGNIHIKVCSEGQVTDSLNELKASPATEKQKAKFILATDGVTFEAEDLEAGDTVACEYADFANHFGFFLALAGITTVKQIRENSFDIKATSRLNRLYLELLKDNPEWGTSARRHEMNHFMARLIFCFFAEDTDIFNGSDLFTATVEQMSERDSSNTHEIIAELFRSMNTKLDDRAKAKFRPWADTFPYVNGGLFSGNLEVPVFSKIARTYLLHVGKLDWTKINPDIFGSMIQAVADDEERGALGMHYTSVPNILKVLNPLFLDDLREKLEEAGNNARKLLNLRNRLARIRVFDPACGSGNFLVIAYKEIRKIEAEVNRRRGEGDRHTNIPLTNYRGIELRDFAAEIARLALIIAEYQCDVMYRGQKEALAEFLPLDTANWITQGNALQVDWLSVCPPTGKSVKYRGDDLFSTPLDQAEIDFENEGGETYICGNPPYKGSTWQSKEEKADLKAIFDGKTKSWKSLDYVAGWFMKAAEYGKHTECVTAFVSTNSICQGQQVPILWPLIFESGHEITFAHTSFKWANLASHNAGVTVVIVGISSTPDATRKLFSLNDNAETVQKEAANINAYLVPAPNVIVNKCSTPISKGLNSVIRGNIPVDGGHLYLNADEKESNHELYEAGLIRLCLGSEEFISNKQKYCLWLKKTEPDAINSSQFITERLKQVSSIRAKSPKKATQDASGKPHLFFECRQTGEEQIIAIPAISSENRPYLPVGLLPAGSIITGKMYGIFDAPLWNMSLIASRLHLVWIATVCVRMRTDFSYSNTLGWNTFPVPKLTEQNKSDLTGCAEDILLAREAHFPATIAELYNIKNKMPDNLRQAHERNDEVLERIYIGRCFKNDTERLETLFKLYTKMTTASV
jgi:hypothetical protein